MIKERSKCVLVLIYNCFCSAAVWCCTCFHKNTQKNRKLAVKETKKHILLSSPRKIFTLNKILFTDDQNFVTRESIYYQICMLTEEKNLSNVSSYGDISTTIFPQVDFTKIPIVILQKIKKKVIDKLFAF